MNFKTGDRVVVMYDDARAVVNRTGFEGTVVGYEHHDTVLVKFDNGYSSNMAGFEGVSLVFERKLEKLPTVVKVEPTTRSSLLEAVQMAAAELEEAEEKYQKAIDALKSFK